MSKRAGKRLPLTPWSLGGIKATPNDIEQPSQQIDPNADRVAKLKA
jgi:hypothetical protein